MSASVGLFSHDNFMSVENNFVSFDTENAILDNDVMPYTPCANEYAPVPMFDQPNQLTNINRDTAQELFVKRLTATFSIQFPEIVGSYHSLTPYVIDQNNQSVYASFISKYTRMSDIAMYMSDITMYQLTGEHRCNNYNYYKHEPTGRIFAHVKWNSEWVEVPAEIREECNALLVEKQD